MTESTEDLPILPTFFLYGVAVAFVMYFVCFWMGKAILVPYLATDSLKQKLKALDGQGTYGFYTLWPSTIHAAAQCFGYPAYISLGFSKSHMENKIMYFDEKWPAFYMGIFVGYMLGDSVNAGPKYLGAVYCIHHFSSALCWTMASHLRTMQWLASFLQFNEFSTFFLNLRGVMLTAGYDSKSSTMMTVNLTFFACFFLVRVAPLPMIVYEWVTQGFMMILNNHGTLATAMVSLFTMIHVGLQTMWFSMMVQKVLAVMGIGGEKKSKKKEA